MGPGDVADPGMRDDHVVESIPSLHGFGGFADHLNVHENNFHHRSFGFKKKPFS
jgi:hypothetical protein